MRGKGRRILAGIICAAMIMAEGNTVMHVQAYSEAPEMSGGGYRVP